MLESPAAVVYCHKVALALVGIGHLIVKKTQVDLHIVHRTHREKEQDKRQE